MHTKRRLIILFLILGIAAVAYLLSPASPLPLSIPHIFDRFTSPRKQNAPGDTTVEVPPSVAVPEPNQKLSDESILIPQSARDAIQGSKEKIRTFSLEGRDGGFSQEKIIVYKNDIVRIEFAAIDGPYGMAFPDFSLSQMAQKGENKTLEFQAISTGTFLFTCTTCQNNPDKKSSFLSPSRTKGILIVVERPSQDSDNSRL